MVLAVVNGTLFWTCYQSVVCFSAKLKFLEHRQQRIAEMRAKYNNLKRELELAKQHLMVDPEKWMHECE